MAITLEANYSKKLGLPQYSSHQYSITVKTEVSDLNQIESESERLYATLQDAVDKEIQQTGYLPLENQQNASQRTQDSSNGAWRCSPKQQDLILKIVEDNNLDKDDIEELSCQMFDKGVRQLNKLEASGLIEQLLEQYGKKQNNRTRGYRNGNRAASSRR